MNYFGQYQQDRFIDDYFKHKSHGTFLDIGAADGIICSNTYFFEKERNYTGICIEPAYNEFLQLEKNRKCTCINCAICDIDGEMEFLEISGEPKGLSGLTKYYNNAHKNRIENEIRASKSNCTLKTVKTYPLQTILDGYNLLNIDFLSLDTEGAEFSILNTINFKRTNIQLILYENNYHESSCRELLSKNGYRFIGTLAIDDVFERIP